MKYKKQMMIGLGSVLGIAAIVMGTLFVSDSLTARETTYGNGYTDSNNVYRPGNTSQNNTGTVVAELPEATVGYEEATYTVEEMITMALTDEYLAHKEYEIILDEYGNVNPFANIIKAEVTHIQELLPLFEAYDVAVPADNAIDRVVLPASLQEAYETGVQAEVNNIGMYEAFLEQDLPADVRTVFEALMAASVKHLDSFSNKAYR